MLWTLVCKIEIIGLVPVALTYFSNLNQYQDICRSLSPPAVHLECASTCAPRMSVFVTDWPEPGSSGLSGWGDTAPPAPRPSEPPLRDAAPLPPTLHVLRWPELAPAPSPCSPLPDRKTEEEKKYNDWEHKGSIYCVIMTTVNWLMLLLKSLHYTP